VVQAFPPNVVERDYFNSGSSLDWEHPDNDFAVRRIQKEVGGKFGDDQGNPTNLYSL
jgi:hypothetical protein